jgi:hypothetical protein
VGEAGGVGGGQKIARAIAGWRYKIKPKPRMAIRG